MTGLGYLAGGGTDSGATAASSNGSVVAGYSDTAIGQQAFRWTSATGMVALPYVSAADNYSAAQGMSLDGSVIVGYSGSSSGATQAFRWTAAVGAVGLGFLTGGDTSVANAVSGDGSIVVGQSSTATGLDAFIWDAAHGMQDLNTYLASLGLNLAGWTLTDATGISSNGLTITGIGTDPSGQSEAFVVTVPEPATLALLGIGALATAIMRRRRK
jgi:probable HAF family extracellular repeat protein